jgi:AcrR family transcriptional regulator
MKKTAAIKTARKPRAGASAGEDLLCNFENSLSVALGVGASMDEISKRAKIGPGTLYRHFPTRDDLLAAVYISEVEKLAEAQKKFSASLPPADALRAWMLVFVEYIAAKRIIAPALDAMVGGPSRVFQQTNRLMERAANALGSRAVASGDLRPDIDPMDMLRALYGISSASNSEDWLAKARRFVDILLLGSRPSVT